MIHPFLDRAGIHVKNKVSNFLFSYSMVKDVYPEIIKNWYNLPLEMYPIRSHLVASLEKKSFYSSVDFLIIVQAVEGFWWRFREKSYRMKNSVPLGRKTSLKTILKELLTEFSDIGLLRQIEIDIEAVVDSRHYYSHFLPHSSKPKKLEGFALVDQAKKLQMLLVCCVLSFIGFDNSLINAVLRKVI